MGGCSIFLQLGSGSSISILRWRDFLDRWPIQSLLLILLSPLPLSPLLLLSYISIFFFHTLRNTLRTLYKQHTPWPTNAPVTRSLLSRLPMAISWPGAAQIAIPARSWLSGGARSVAIVGATPVTPQRHRYLFLVFLSLFPAGDWMGPFPEDRSVGKHLFVTCLMYVASAMPCHAAVSYR